MKSKLIFILQFIIIITYVYSSKSSKERINKFDRNYTKNSGKFVHNIKRKLTDEEKNEEDYEEIRFFFDFTNFNYTFPNETLGEDSKDIIIEGIYKARDIITDLFNMEINCIPVIEENGLEGWVTYWDNALLGLNDYEYNYLIFFRFSSLQNDASSEIFLDCGTNPSGGVITINENMDTTKLEINYLTNLFLHQFFHLLGFHVNNEAYDYSTIGEEEDEEEDGEKLLHYYLSESNGNLKVISYARSYFNCSKIDRINLELNEDGDIHWPSRLFLGDIMTEFNYPEEQVISGFTMAFMDELEFIWIKKNYTGGLMKFGKGKGCDFFNKSCSEQVGNKITFSNEFYLPVITPGSPISNFEPSCTSGRLSKTIHKLHYYAEVPEEYEYFQNNYGGLKYTNYCPISEYNSINSDYRYSGRCSESSTSIDQDLESKLGEIFASNSFCVLSTLISKEVENYQTYSELRAVCYEMFCSSKSLTIKIKNNYIVCPRSGGKIEAENFYGYILCPDYNLICSGENMYNSILNCIGEGSKEKENAHEYDYEIKTTQNSSTYNSEPKIYGYELTTEEEDTCPYYGLNEQENKCFQIVPNCIKFEDDINDICVLCASDYYLVLEDNGTKICLEKELINTEKEYYIEEG